MKLKRVKRKIPICKRNGSCRDELYLNVSHFSRIIYFVRNVWVWPAFEAEASNFTVKIGKIYSKRLASIYSIIGSQLKNCLAAYIHTALLNHFFLIMDIRLIIVLIVFFFFFLYIHDTTHLLRLSLFFFSLSKLYVCTYSRCGHEGTRPSNSIQFPFILVSPGLSNAKKENKMIFSES